MNASQDMVLCITAGIRSFCHCQAPRCSKLLSQQDSSRMPRWEQPKATTGKEDWVTWAAGAGEGLGQCSGKGGKEKLSLLSCSWQRDDHTADHRYDVSGFVPSNLNRLILV